MTLSTEAMLMLLATALYLVDCLQLLHSNEALLIKTRKHWMARFGASRWVLGGREPCWVNVLTPHRPAFRLQWQFEAEGARVNASALATAPIVARLAPFAYLGLLLVFVGLPLALFANLGLVFTLVVVTGIYLNNLVALLLLFWMRKRVGLGTAKYWSMAFECFVCPPFCIQLAKRVYALQPVRADFLQACAQVLPPDAQAEVKRQCLARLDDQIAFEAEDTARAAALRLARNRFDTGVAL